MVRALACHGVLPLAHFALKTSADSGHRPESEVPHALRRAAAAEYMASAAHAALRLRELGEIVDALAVQGIDVLVLKGAALAETAYENVALRPMGDMDLLIRERELDVAGRVLEGRGYYFKADEAPDLAHHWAFSRYLDAGVESVIELHRRPFATPPLDQALACDDLFERAESATVGGRELPIPSRPDMLLHLAGHLVLQHAREERLIWVADVDRVARQLDDAGWRAVVERAAQCGLTLAVVDALSAARFWFGTTIPPEVAIDLETTAKADAGAAAAHARLRARAPLGLEGARRFTDLRGAKGLRRKVRYALAFAFPPASYMRERHGVDRLSSLPIYYARRVARGLLHVASEVTRRPKDAWAADEPPERWMIEPDSPAHMD